MSAQNSPKTDIEITRRKKLTRSHKINIGQILLERGKISPEDAEKILLLQKENKGMHFGEAGKQLGLIDESDVKLALAQQFDYPYLLPGQGNYPPELVAAYQPFSEQMEIFRAVRSQLMLRWFSPEHKALTVVGVTPRGGASFLAANLAVVFSQLGERTLLVDANLRQPCQHKIFDVKSRQGLSDILAGRVDMLDVISKVNSFLELSVLPAGTLPPNPLELLGHSSFVDLSEKLANQFDIILYDVSPFSVAADALAIATCTGGILLVTRKNATRLSDVNNISEQIAFSGAKIVGSVLLDF
jgi:protein-tyrosine kinase